MIECIIMVPSSLHVTPNGNLGSSWWDLIS